jgi:hypothetical protein
MKFTILNGLILLINFTEINTTKIERSKGAIEIYSDEIVKGIKFADKNTIIAQVIDVRKVCVSSIELGGSNICNNPNKQVIGKRNARYIKETLTIFKINDFKTFLCIF